ncbi:MAG TPA: hypothetical protein VHK47_12175 [Polyangia bacterium]|jgi:hypothetical protein|nr:hypothetical protein [Polyangia bacterium]HVZ77857.1 hypothetical protein [Gemmatimonadaceae bacterium]
MTRPLVAFLGLGLAVLWVIARSEDATSWMVWFEGATALGVMGIVGLIPARRSAPLAGGCLFGLSLALFALWWVALVVNGTPWFAWWIFTFAWLCLATAAAVAYQGFIDDMRAPDVV